MEYKGHRLRHELKFLISHAEYNALAAAISVFMPADENSAEGGYAIRSLYFDDIYQSAYEDKQAGIQRRRKYRVRIYNLSDEVIKFEIKDKYDSYISKRSASITREDVESMLNRDFSFMIRSDSAALRSGYIDAQTKLLHPAVVVDYFREAYVGEEGNVRITFDSDLRAGFSSFDIFDRDMVTLPAMQEGTLTLEVKYDDYLPTTVQKLLAPLNSRQTTLSKYVMCRDIQNLYYRKDMPYGIS